MGRSHLKRELAGVALVLVGVFVAGAVLVQRTPDSGACTDAHGFFGPAGACVREGLVGFLGLPTALLLPLGAVVLGARCFGHGDAEPPRRWSLLLSGLVLLLPVLFGLAVGATREESVLAGVWGGLVAYYMAQAFGSAGAWLVLLLALSVLTVTTLSWNPVRALLVRPRRAPSAPEEAGASRVEPDMAMRLAPAPEEMPALDPRYVAEVSGEVAAVPEPADRGKGRRDRKPGKGDAAAARAERIAAEIEASEHPEPHAAEDLPTPELLTPAPARNVDAGRRELDAAGVKLMEALRTFRVEGELVGRTTGPTVTQFEIEPAPGVKVRQFATLSNDLALAMRAPSIRIVAPIPGKGAVGVEVPNPTPEMVAFRDIVEAREFGAARAALPIALGKDLEGKAVVADLAKMPHLLIAGATGSGKSVCVNTIITSLIYRHTPKTLRFLMVDPKMVELSVYNILPHLRHKVITDNRDAAAVLKWAVLEMNERYELLAANACRNIQDFNKRVQDGVPLKRPRRPDVAFESLVYTDGILPYIVVIIDEMADLMMTVQGEVETPIAMLAQKARAIGIHLILATQRPSVNVITGLIKANFPSRIAFRVASQVDSRTIIDGAGAEMLLGNGDMLFIPPGRSEPSRLQGAYLSSEDTERLMNWYEQQRDARRAALAAQGLATDAEPETEPDIL
ncbi:MAG TPA: DNA translocase FtsK 4TM domain-containing protein, partial [Gemmatimonadaceae bacterium]|nr:DNA translocase FtsK 4TM domain-containing protein [Gemmatimonadaceae bacterium]